MLSLLQRSASEQSPIDIIYMDSNQKCTKRTIIVKEQKFDYVVAYCFLRKRVRTFRVQNILAISKKSPKTTSYIS